MSSDNKKIFTTQAASKGAGVDVTSDVIALPDDTSEAILSVKTDASCTGVVDVKLEMSPDGTNWCPAVTRTVSANVVNVEPKIGNEEYVKLTPDAGEFKNKHARGGLNFDVNGAVVTPDGTGARDLMHQHIGVDKSFNYSQWFKTSEAPTTTYKPVLFRHGGYDNFENLKVIQTDGTTKTQNLSEQIGLSNTKDAMNVEYEFDSTITSGLLPTDSWTIGYWLDLSKLNSAGTNYSGISNVSNATATGLQSTDTVYGSNFYNRWYPFITWRSGVQVFNGSGAQYYTITDWTASYFIVKRLDASAGVGGTGVAHVDIFKDDGTQVFNQQYTYTIPSGYTVGAGVTWTAQSGYINADDMIILDNFTSDANLSTLYQTVGSTIKPKDFSSTSGVNAWYRIGDNGTDDLSDAANHKGTFPDLYSANTGALTTLSSSDNLYLASTDNQTLFSTSNNLSISGWFKTTDTGTLFSNSEGTSGLTAGFTLNLTDAGGSNQILVFFNGSPAQAYTINIDTMDGEWHHILFTKDTSQQITVYIDGVQQDQRTRTISDTDLKGSNGFTLLSDGQNNINNPSPASTDISKLSASISNWSLHSEVLDEYAAKQLYSNGHVRNAKNLPGVDATQIVSLWQLSDVSNPEQDSASNVDLHYTDGTSAPLTDYVVDADGATLVQDTINGNAMTLSLTKSFNFTTKEWVETADQETALCLSFNGFEEQAEHIALWKCSQTVGGSTIDICDGNWHNVILSYRGNNDLAGDNVAEGDVVKFGPGPAQNLAHNWMMSFDGEPLKAINDGSGADHIDGLGSTVTDTYNSVVYNVGFNIYNRHLKYEASNTEEEYKPHAQFSAGIHEVTGVDNINAFQGSVDETSFHSDCWWVDQAGTSVIANTFNQEKPATIYGSTTALTDRGAGTAYPVGVPYPLTSPEEIGSARGGNQWINPYRKGEVQEDANTSIGGVEGWWRWGDTPGDCSVTINDVRDHDDSINARDIAAFEIVTADRQDMSVNNESIYNETISSAVATGSVAITFPQIVVAGIQAGICNLKQISSPLLKYLRVKFTGAGSCDLGSSSTQAQINFRSKE
jgi:hypothetical protein